MNSKKQPPNNETLPPADDQSNQLFDLLADDELDDTRRRELLGGLDDRPGGWRRCAMAFLEAQSWRREMKGFLDEPSPETVPTLLEKPTPKKNDTPPPKRRKRFNLSNPLLSMAASFLLAIGLTSLIQDMRHGGGPVIGGSGSQFASVVDQGAQQAGISPLGFSIEPHKDVQLVRINGRAPSGKPQSVRLPAIAQDRLDHSWLKTMPSAIPAELVQQYQQAGHEVQTSRQLLPIRLSDGRKLVIPVDQLDVHYTSLPAYQ